MDIAWRQRQIRKLHIRKAAQVGVSEAMRNVMAFMGHLEPDPILLLLPDEKTGKRVMSKRILPLFEDTPVLKELKTDASRDQGLTQVLLANGFNLSLAWSGSAATMAADPQRGVFIDETDKSKEWDGKESGPVELADVRTTTYEDSILFTYSTPTTPDRPTTQLTENAPIQIRYFCPCPHCGTFQEIAWERVKYPKKGTVKPAAFDRVDEATWAATIAETDKSKRAALVETHRLGWYECAKCSGVVLDHQRQKMLLKGYWGTTDGEYKLFFDGTEEGSLPPGSEVAAHYPAMLDLAAKHKFYRMVAEWIRCEGDIQRTQGFYNSWLAEAFKIQTRKIEPNAIRDKRDGAPEPRVIPKWARLLIATADVQGNDPSTGYFYYVIRAWGYEYRSQLIDYGIVNTFDELKQECLTRQLPIEGGGMASATTLLIDSGNRADEVYQFALTDPERIKPTKGSSTRLSWPVQKTLQRRSGVILWNIDTEKTKDLLNRLMNDPDPKQWQVHNAINDDYCQQLTAETKSVNPKTKREEWVKKTSSTPNHLLDCEQQQCAAAWDAGCGMQEPAQPNPPPAPAQTQRPSWIPEKPTSWVR
jgi:phage terminase large subunit GpA-like protein